jgi:hypothetical protein
MLGSQSAYTPFQTLNPRALPKDHRYCRVQLPYQPLSNASSRQVHVYSMQRCPGFFRTLSEMCTQQRPQLTGL